jgi:RND superfamily putative drug exporter
MDYEMFLVSAMREHYVLTGDPHKSVVDGFRASSRVVTAAALIMTSVFVAFIPGGPATIKQIAFGLAVGVSVDAFLVRMTLVPAVLVLLGKRAWWLPRWLDRALPVVDVEGAALHRKLAFDDYQAEHGPTTLLASDLVVLGIATPVQVSAEAGTVNHLAVPDGADPGAVARVLAGRRPAAAGEVVVDGLLLPQQREAVIRRTALLELVSPDRSEGSVTDRVRDRVRLQTLSGRRRTELTERALLLVDELAAAAAPRGADGTVAAAVVDAALGLSSGVDVFVFSGLDGQTDPDRRSAELLGEELARRGATVVVVAHGTAPAPPSVPLATIGSPPDQVPLPGRAEAPVPDVDSSVRTNDE